MFSKISTSMDPLTGCVAKLQLIQICFSVYYTILTPSCRVFSHCTALFHLLKPWTLNFSLWTSTLWTLLFELLFVICCVLIIWCTWLYWNLVLGLLLSPLTHPPIHPLPHPSREVHFAQTRKPNSYVIHLNTQQDFHDILEWLIWGATLWLLQVAITV